jgi:hypothetical protein
VLAPLPPLKASTCTRRCGLTKVNDPLVGPDPLNPMLLVVNCRHGDDKYQAVAPQSITPVGYWPFSGRFGFVRSLKVMVDRGDRLGWNRSGCGTQAYPHSFTRCDGRWERGARSCLGRGLSWRDTSAVGVPVRVGV